MICGDTGKRELTRTILRACERYGGVFAKDGDRLWASCEEPLFSVICTDSLTEVDCRSIVVFGEHPHISGSMLKMKGALYVIDSSSLQAVSLLCSCPLPAIGCSMSPYDTLSISGREDKEVLVCLQRSVQCIDGKWLEPCEIAVEAPPETQVFPILAACAVLLLSSVPFEHGYKLI